MPQFFSRRPVVIQDITDSPLRGALMRDMKSREHLRNAMALGQGMTSIGQAFGGSPEDKRAIGAGLASMGKSIGDQKLREEQRESANVNTAMQLGIDIDTVKGFREGTLSAKDLRDAITVAQEPGPKKFKAEQDQIRDFETKLGQRRQQQEQDLELTFGALKDAIVTASGGQISEEEAEKQAATAYLQKSGAIRTARDKDGMSVKDALTLSGGDIDKALAIMDLEDSVGVGKEVPSEVRETLQGFQTPATQRIGQAAKRLTLSEDIADRLKTQAEQRSQRLEKLDLANEKTQVDLAAAKDVGARNKILESRIGGMRQERLRLMGDLRDQKSNLAEAEAVFGKSNPEMLAPFQQLVNEFNEDVIDLTGQMEKLRKQQEALVTSPETATAGPATDKELEDALGGG